MPVRNLDPPVRNRVIRLALALLVGGLSVWRAVVPSDGLAADDPAGAAEIRGALDWAETFYGRGPFCSTAVVTGVEAEPPSLLVHLDIDPRWAADLGRMAPGLRDGWFRLHCPFVLEPVWSRLPVGGDVLIQGRVPGMGVVRVGCRAAHDP